MKARIDICPRYRLAPGVVSRYESRLGFGVVFDPSAHKARRIDRLAHGVLDILAASPLSIDRLAELMSLPRQWAEKLCQQLANENILIVGQGGRKRRRPRVKCRMR